jgi:hypothetical protein
VTVPAFMASRMTVEEVRSSFALDPRNGFDCLVDIASGLLHALAEFGNAPEEPNSARGGYAVRNSTTISLRPLLSNRS